MLIVVNRCAGTLELCQQSERAVIMINSCVEGERERERERKRAKLDLRYECSIKRQIIST